MQQISDRVVCRWNVEAFYSINHTGGGTSNAPPLIFAEGSATLNVSNLGFYGLSLDAASDYIFCISNNSPLIRILCIF
jgi:hypothetical protein